MSDAKYKRATSWKEVIAIHRKWMRDYNVQRVRRVGADRIPFTERRGWSNTPGSRDSPSGETQRGPKHVTKALKRKKTLTPLAMQDPRDTAKLGLLNSSSQRFEGWPFASTASSCRDTGIQLPCR